MMPVSGRLALFAILSALVVGAASGVEPDAAQADRDSRLRRILDDWHRRAAEVTSVDVRYAGETRMPKWGDEPFAGRVVLLRDGRAFLEQSRRRGGGPPVLSSLMLWTPDEVHQVFISEKKKLTWPRPGEARDRLPAVLALPFLWHVSVEVLLSRYDVALVKEDETRYVLSFTPKTEAGRSSFARAWLVIDRSTYRPQRYVLVDPDGETRKDFRVAQARYNGPVPEADLALPAGDGWQVKRSEVPLESTWIGRSFRPDRLP